MTFELPETLDRPADLLAVHASMLKAVAGGEISLEAGQQLSAIIQGHIRVAEATELEQRIAALEAKA